MKVKLERECSETKRLLAIANFKSVVDARPCAELLSKLDDCTYKITDDRFPETDESEKIEFYVKGQSIA